MKRSVDSLVPVQLQTTFISVDKETLIKSLRVAEDSRAFAKQLLSDVDAGGGRSTRQGKVWAEHLEESVRNAEAAIAELRESLGYRLIAGADSCQ
jgi:hypothetical protein